MGGANTLTFAAAAPAGFRSVDMLEAVGGAVGMRLGLSARVLRARGGWDWDWDWDWGRADGGVLVDEGENVVDDIVGLGKVGRWFRWVRREG